MIVQNFRAKANTPMRRQAEPLPSWFARVVALARWIMGPTMNIQVPPNLTERFEVYLDAGINDWGGVSPLTIDWVNPEQPWPHLDELEARTSRGRVRTGAAAPGLPGVCNARLDRSEGSGPGCRRQATSTGTLPSPRWRSQPCDRHVLPGPARDPRQ